MLRVPARSPSAGGGGSPPAGPWTCLGGSDRDAETDVVAPRTSGHAMSTSVTERLHEQDDTEALHARWGFERDPRARDALVERYQGLVRQLASRYKASTEDFDDLIQVGNVGLLNALERFDADRGVPFRGFAIPTILGELRRY